MGKQGFKTLGWVWIAGCAVAAWGQAASGAAVRIVREIDDQPTGNRWLLERDPARPAGPGRLVLAGGRSNRAAGEPTAMKDNAPVPVIRPGDRIIVEQHTPILDARLEAVALNPAFTGSPLAVRLVIGGRVVRALALGPGRARLAPEGVRP
jgi:hypothetical protein